MCTYGLKREIKMLYINDGKLLVNKKIESKIDLDLGMLRLKIMCKYNL